ncbi:MAG: (S)-3,5-dihydroxyphenylglycine transaminase [Actinomycetota bacterium]|jgi:(S)-3,5-dihydroxyphenylglycine transaminase|nr:(S)-3,5-dihydroxyphenylglycine transaminase [Actinomycetota bacterium]
MVRIAAGELHRSLSDPVLDAMALLNEIAARHPSAVSFAPGWPAEDPFELADVDRYLRHYARYLEEERGFSANDVRDRLFRYGPAAGIIRELVVRHLAADEGMRVDPASVLVTVGCQEALIVVLRTLFDDPRDVLLVQSPCYFGISGAARLLDIEIVPVPESEAGLRPARVAEIAAQVRASGRRPRALYVIPDFANPSGLTLPVEAREALLDVAAAEDLLVLEDNPYGFYSRFDRRMPTLKSLDRRGQVIYLGSFSKTCAPGVRVGYLVADQEVHRSDGRRSLLAEELTKVKSMITVNTSPITQSIVAGMLVAGGFALRDANAGRVAEVADRMNVLLAEVRAKLTPIRDRATEISWTEPDGGFFVVIRLPFRVDAEALEESAARFGVLWTPMSLFYQEGGDHELRLSASHADPDQIRLGVDRLAKFIEHRLDTA